MLTQTRGSEFPCLVDLVAQSLILGALSIRSDVRLQGGEKNSCSFLEVPAPLIRRSCPLSWNELADKAVRKSPRHRGDLNKITAQPAGG